MQTRFFSLDGSTPAGFESGVPGPAELLDHTVVLFAASPQAPLALLDDFARRVRGLIVTVADRRGCTSLGPHLWHLAVPDSALPDLRSVAGAALVLTGLDARSGDDRSSGLLEESEAQLSSIFRAAPVGIGLVSKRIFTKANALLCEMVGYTEQELLGQSSRMLYESDEAYDLVGDEKYRLIGLHGTGTVETRWLRKDGRVIDVLLSSTPLDLGDQEKGVTFTALDITDRVQAAEEKRLLEEQYHQAQKVESIGRLAGGVAHDLNNLLAPILGYSELLLQDGLPDIGQRESVENIQHAGLRARDLVRQLLAFGRKQTLEYKPLDLNATVTGFESLMRHTIREDIAINISITEELPPIMADTGQIEQVLMNLMVNAQDAMPDGGRLSLSTGLTELDAAYAGNHPGVEPGPYVMLAVNDTGCGMSEETLQQIFEPFFSTKGALGTGLGLATVYGIVKQHGGNVWVYSEPGAGTTFKIYLPVTEVTEKAAPQPAPVGGPHTGTETVLVVEDNEQVRDLACRILARCGYRVESAGNGPEALSVFGGMGGAVDLLLTDVVLPDTDGKEIHAHLAAQRPGLKVLFMSGYTDDVIVDRGVLKQGVAFIQKPFSVDGLAARVRQVLDSDG